MQAGGDVDVDRRVGEVDLDDPDPACRRARPSAGSTPRRPPVRRAPWSLLSVFRWVSVATTVPWAASMRLVLGLVAESGAVVGEHHVAGQVPQAQAQDVVPADRLGHEPVEVPRLRSAQVIAEGTAVEEWIDGRLGHEQRL